MCASNNELSGSSGGIKSLKNIRGCRGTLESEVPPAAVTPAYAADHHKLPNMPLVSELGRHPKSAIRVCYGTFVSIQAG